MKQFIYADNAATTKLNNEAFKAMLPWFADEYGNASQPYSFARKPKQALANARSSIAKCINAEPDEIYFTSGGTESDNWAIKGSAFSDWNKCVTITSAIEHQAVLRACKSIEKLGYPVAYLHANSKGIITPESLAAIITSKTRLVSIMYANNEIGTIQPIKELVAIAHANKAIFHTDAVQAIGHVNIDVKELDVDMLSASAHKFNGPKGVGFLYIKKGISISPYADGGSQEHGARAGTENIAGIVGMATALEFNCKRIVENSTHLKALEAYLIERLTAAEIDFIHNGDKNHIPGNISLSFHEQDGETLLHRLDLMGIIVSTGSACDSVNSQVSHVINDIGLAKEYARGTIRISLSSENSLEDITKIATAIIKIIKAA